MTEPAPGTVPAIEKVNPIKGLVQKEPVVVSYVVTDLLANAGAYILGHTHLVNSAQWDTFTTAVTPVISTAILGGLAFLTRKYVYPVVKKVDPSLLK